MAATLEAELAARAGGVEEVRCDLMSFAPTAASTATPATTATPTSISATMPWKRPKIVGIVNLTADSFFDGGRYLQPDAAIAHAHQLAEDGADIIELGPASSGPDAAPVSPEEEIDRLKAVLPNIRTFGVAVGVDSYRLETQRWCINAGVDMINDVRGFPDPALYSQLAATGCLLVVMHSVSTKGQAERVRTEPEEVLRAARSFLAERTGALVDAGVDAARIVVDPGMGFFLGDTPGPSVAMLRNLRTLGSELGHPVEISVSRKSFLRALTGATAEQAGAATLAAELFAATQGAAFVRTHDVRALRDALVVWEALMNNEPIQ